MLQVPCLSPPIYGHRHYKKFWLKQTSEGVPGSSQSSAPASVSGALEMAAAAAPPASDVSKRISGKRRPQLRKVEASSPEHPQFGWNSPSPSPLSTVENRDSDDPESCKDFFISSAGLSPVDDLPVETEREAEDKLVVRQNRSCEDISQSSEQTAGGLSQEDQVNRIKSSDTSASDSDSSTSSTSEASDHEDARRHSGKSTTFRQYLKRQSSSTAKVKTGGDEELLGLVSPKTRQASAALALAVSGPGASPVLATTTTTTNTATVDPVSPRLGSSSPTNSIRTCHHCGTMKTPLWRNGPSGPKSLCNACGIRLRKAKRNNSQEGGGATGATTGTQASSGKRKLNGETGAGMSAGNGATLSKPQKKSRVPSKRDVRSMPPPTSDDSNTDWDEASAIEVLATLIQLRDAKI